MMMNYFVCFLVLILVSSCKPSGSVSDDFPLKVNVNTNNTTSETSSEYAELKFTDYPSYNFQEKVINSETLYSLILKNNSSHQSTNLSGVSLSFPFGYAGGSYPGSGGTCSTSLNAGSQCTVIISFNPTTTGTKQTTLKLNYQFGSIVKTARVGLNGEGIKATLAQSGLGNTFNNTVADTTSSTTVTVSNSGKYAASSMTSSTLSAPFSFTGGSYPGTSGTCSGSLEPSTTCLLDLSFNPTSATTYTENLVLDYSNGDTTDSLTISLSGQGTAPALLSMNSTTDFGTAAVDSSSEVTINITYSGEYSASDVTSSALSGPFSYSTGVYPGGGTCGNNILADCTVILRYSPTDITENSAPFTLTYFNGGTTDSISTNLVGKTTPELTFGNASEDLGLCGISSTCQKSVTINYVGFTGWPDITDMTASMVSVAQGFSVAGGGTCGGTLSFGVGSCTYNIDFKTNYKGSYQDTIQLEYNNTDSTRSVIIPIYAQTYITSNDAHVGQTTGGASASGTDVVTGIATNEANKEIFVLGYTDGDLGGAVNEGSTDIFLLKFDSDLSLVNQSKPAALNMAGGETTTVLFHDETISSQYLYATGYTNGDLVETAQGSTDVFISYYDRTNLNHQGTTHLGHLYGGGSVTGDDYSYALTLTSTGDVFIGGKTSSNIETGKTATGDDAFVIKFDGALTHTWTQMLSIPDVTSEGDESIYGIGVSASGDMIVAGTTTGNLIETNGGGRDIFVASIADADGSVNWVKHYGATTLGINASGDDFVKGLLVDPRDYIYIIGNTTGDIDGNGNAGLNDVFVIRAEKDGTFKNAYQAGTTRLGSNGTGDDIVTGVSLDAYNNIHITGYTDGGTENGTNGGGTDAFSFIFDTKNNQFYFHQISGGNAAGNEIMGVGNSSAVDSSSSNYFIAGSTSGDFMETGQGPLDAFLSVRSYLDYGGFSPKPYLEFDSTPDYFGSIADAATASKLVKVLYFGDREPLTNVNSTSIGNTTHFNFTGGSFPGTAGTCSSTVTDDCFLDITYDPQGAGSHSTYIDAYYRVNGEGSNQSSRLIIKGDAF